MQEKVNGHVILINGPSGSGKGVLMRHLRAAFPELVFAVSCTTREMRDGEIEGTDYYFLSDEIFQQKINEGAFVEWAMYGGHRYGTLQSELTVPLLEGKIVVHEIELQGIQLLKNIVHVENLTTIYIDAGSWEALVHRIQARSPMNQEELEKRHERYLEESKAKSEASVIIQNGEGQLEAAKHEIETIVKKIITQKNV